VTALARHTLRAGAISRQSLTGMLGTLHQALRRQPPGADLCTVCLVLMTPRADGSMGLTVALAGHHPPLIVDRDGQATPVGWPGTLLGVLDPIEITESETVLQADQTLLLYTDGVSEAGKSTGPLGEEGVIELCRRAPELGLANLLEHVERAALERAEGKLRDDIALLAARIAPGP
jgi:sigma-B regulation protein RsbU (phosphoserine phosphatase)